MANVVVESRPPLRSTTADVGCCLIDAPPVPMRSVPPSRTAPPSSEKALKPPDRPNIRQASHWWQVPLPRHQVTFSIDCAAPSSKMKAESLANTMPSDTPSVHGRRGIDGDCGYVFVAGR